MGLYKSALAKNNLQICNFSIRFCSDRLFYFALILRYSWGDAFSKERDAQLNMGENAAITSDMPFMAYKLLRRMNLDRRINMKLHWKIITLMIGLNDFCSNICHRKTSPYWMNWEIEDNIIKTLRIIRDTMPR